MDLTSGGALAIAISNRCDRIRITIFELFDMFPDERTAREWFERLRWKDGRSCPICGCAETVVRKNEKPLPYRCKSCRRDFSVKTGTIMHKSKITLQQWAIGIHLMSASLKGTSSMRLHRELGLSQKSAWMMERKIRRGWDRGKTRLTDSADTDGSAFGERGSNGDSSKSLCEAHGTVGRTEVVDVSSVDREIQDERGKESTSDVPRRQLLAIVEERLEVNSAGYKGYNRFDLIFASEPVNHSICVSLHDQFRAPGLEMLQSTMKRGYDGFRNVTSHNVVINIDMDTRVGITCVF